MKCSCWVAALLLACAVATGCTLTTDVCDNADCDAEQECFAVDGAAVCLTPCAAADDCQDDGDPCTMTVCESDTRADQGMFCATAPVDCGAELCDAETGACVECIEDDDCTEPQICVDHACVPPCTSDAACDDGLDCTNDACTDQNTCENTSTCPEETPHCSAGGCVECIEDADCDDGLGCNGEEACADAACQPGEPPCDPCTESCDETEGEALCFTIPAEAFEFTADPDNLIGTECDDLFIARDVWTPGTPVFTLQTGDSADGLGGIDTLEVYHENLSSPTIAIPTINGIEIFDITHLGVGELRLIARYTSGVEEINMIDSTHFVEVSELQDVVDIRVENTGADLEVSFVSPVTSGSEDEINIVFSGISGSTITLTTESANGFEAVSFLSDGDTLNTLAELVQEVGTTLARAAFAGDQDLRITTLPHTMVTYDASGMTGGLTLSAGENPNVNILITGGSGDDDLTGSAQADVIEGGAGADTLTGGDGTDVFVYTVETDSLNTVLDTVTDFISGSDKFDVPNPPTNAGDGSAGADLTHVTVTSTGQTAATLAQDLAAVADGAAANEWDQPGDTHVVKLRGASLGGMDAVYLVIEDGTLPRTYDATEDLVLQVSDRRDVTLSISDFQ